MIGLTVIEQFRIDYPGVLEKVEAEMDWSGPRGSAERGEGVRREGRSAHKAQGALRHEKRNGREVNEMSCSNPDCRRGGCSTPSDSSGSKKDK